MTNAFTITDAILSHSEHISYVIICVAIISAITVGIAEYKKKLWSYITNKRNKWMFICLAIILALLVALHHKHWIEGWNLIFASAAWLVASVAYVVSLRPKRFIGFSDLTLKQYERWLFDGSAIEHLTFFDKGKPWYFFSKSESMEYYMLACQYYVDVKDFDKAYKSLGCIDGSYLYDEEKRLVDLQKAMLLALMGNMKAALQILGDPEKNQSDHPMIWFAYSYIYENAGDVDKALEFAEKSRSIIDAGYKAPLFEVAEIYNNYARVAIFKGNMQEALRYLDIAWEKVKKSGDMRTIHIVASNRIINMAVSGRSRTECEDALKEYSDLIRNDSYMNKVELNNCAVLMYRQFRDANMENKLIKEGYESIVNHLDSSQTLVFTASTFRMLLNGNFDYTWLDDYICKDMKEYMKLPLTGRLSVFREYMSFYEQEAFRALYNRPPYLGLRKKIMKYYQETAITEIEEAIKKVEPNNIYGYMHLMLFKLGILKVTEGKQHINKSKSIYIELYRYLYDCGLHLDAINVLMTLIDECTSSYNVLISSPYAPMQIVYSDLLKASELLPPPVLLPDGIHMAIPRVIPREPFEIMPLHIDVLKEYIDIVITEFRQWKNHPFKVNLSIEIMHILLCLDRKEDAKEFYLFFKRSGVSEMQLASWAREDLADMENEFGK